MSSPYTAASSICAVYISKILHFPLKLFKKVIKDIFRMLNPQQLLNMAEAKIIDDRYDSVTYSAKFLVPQKDDIWGENNPINKHSLSLAVAGLSEQPKSDEHFMSKFLAKSSPNMMIDPQIVPFKDMIPCGAPIIEFLRWDATRFDSWNYPSKRTLDAWRHDRSMNSNYPMAVDVREIIIGVTSEEEIEEFSKWVFEKIKEDETVMPTNTLSFDVEEIPITNFDFIRMGMPEYVGKDIKLTRKLNAFTEDEAELFEDKTDRNLNLPVKVMFGNGITWAALISMPIRRVPGAYVYKACEVSKKIPELLNNLPPVQGLNIKCDVDIVQIVFTYLTGERVRMKGFVDLESLAVLAGWRLNATNMTAMSAIALGSIMNKCVSQGDKKWGLKYADLPASLKAYAIADLKFGHMAYRVLMSCLLREMFPDPDVACNFSNTDQFGYVKWFCKWIADVVDGLQVYTPARDKATKREELVDSLRYRDLRGELSPHPPARISTFKSLLHGQVPTITCGGARYLHSAREHYIDQYNVLYECKMDLMMFPEPTTKEMRWYARFGRVGLKEIDMRAPVPRYATEYPTSLVTPREIRDSLIEPEIHDLSFADLKANARAAGRDLRPAVYEWARIDPYMHIYKLLDKIDNDDFFSECFKGYYEDLRLMYVASVNKDPVKPKLIERLMSEQFEKRYKEEKEKLVYYEKALRKQKEIVDQLEDYEDLPRHRSRNYWKNLPFEPVQKTRVLVVPDLSYRRESKVTPTNQNPEKVGRPRSIQQFEHRRQPSVSDLSSRRTWLSDERDRELTNDFVIPIQPATQKDPDEHSMGAMASRSGKRKKGKAATSTTTSKSSRFMTQDEYEEYDNSNNGFELINAESNARY